MVVPAGARDDDPDRIRAFIFMQPEAANGLNSAEEQSLRVHLLGRFSVSVNGRSIPVKRWTRKASVAALKLLVLGDFTGHGLPASIGGPLVTYVFHSLLGQNGSTSEVLQEINRVLHDQLPVTMYMAACAVEISPQRDRVKVWNAGIPDGINWLADAYAQQFASAGGLRNLSLRVAGVTDFDSYARVLSYLESVTMLSEVHVESYRGGELLLRVVSRGDAPVLARTFNLARVLRERNTVPGNGSAPFGLGATLDLVVVPERSAFGEVNSGFVGSE